MRRTLTALLILLLSGATLALLLTRPAGIPGYRLTGMLCHAATMATATINADTPVCFRDPNGGLVLILSANGGNLYPPLFQAPTTSPTPAFTYAASNPQRSVGAPYGGH